MVTAGQPLLSGAVGLLFCVLLVVLLLPMIAERLRIPGLIGLIAGGFLLGDSGLHLVNVESLAGLGQVGLLYLMFLAGLELDLDVLARNRASGVRFGLLTFVLPFALGVLAGVWAGLDGWALPLIGSVWASHTLVTYPTVQRRGLVGSRSVVVSVGATVITVTLALLVLAFVAGGDEHGSAALLPVAAGLVALLVFTMVVLPWAARLWFRGQGQDRAARYVFVVAGFLAAALLAQVFGIEGIVGAFFAGLGLNRVVPNGSPLMAKVQFVGEALFIPFFVISIGLLLDPAVMAQLRTLELAVAFTLAVVVGKALAAWIAGATGGFSRDEIGLMFSLTLPQAAGTFAAVSVGFSLGLFDIAVLNASLIVVLISLLLASWTTQRFAVRIPVQRGLARPIGTRVLAGLADPEQAATLLPLATALARHDAGTVSPVHVIADELPPDGVVTEFRHELGDAVAAAGAEGEAQVRLDRSTAAGLRNAAIESDASVVVVGNRLRGGPGGWFRDRAVAEVVAASPVPVLVVVGLPRVRRVLVLVGSAEARPSAVVGLAMLGQVARGIGGAWRLPVAVLAPDDVSADALAAFGDAEVLRCSDPFGNACGHVDAGDLVIGPTGAGAVVIDPHYRRIASIPGTGLIVVAGPGQAGAGDPFAAEAPFTQQS